MTQTTVTRQAFMVPSTANDSNRTCELVVATENPTRGLVLQCRAGAVSLPAAPPPICLDHNHTTAGMAGRITSIRFEDRKLIATASFNDAPAADQGWMIARSGCAVSVGASFDPLDLIEEKNYEVCPRWTLLEASLVPVPGDKNCLVRSNNSPEVPTPMNTTQPTEAQTEETRAALKREVQIRRYAADIKLDAATTQEYIDSGKPIETVISEVLRAYADKVNAPAASAGHPARQFQSSGGDDLESILLKKLKGEPTIELARALEPCVFNDPMASRGLHRGSVSSREILTRAWSTSDFVLSLTSSLDRLVLDAYNRPPEGIRQIARFRQLADFRTVRELRFTQFGSLDAKPEGGDYQYENMSEEGATSLTAREYGAVAELTRVAFSNDDLGMVGSMMTEMAKAAVLLEAELLAERLLNGFTWTAANSVGSLASIQAAITAGTLLLRRQIDANGKRVSFTPTHLLVAPEQEGAAKALLGGQYMPTAPTGVNPFTVELLVDAQLTAANVMYLIDSQYPPLVCGTIGAPALTQEEEFSNGNRKFRIQHDAVAGVADQRSIARLTLT